MKEKTIRIICNKPPSFASYRCGWTSCTRRSDGWYVVEFNKTQYEATKMSEHCPFDINN